MNSSHPFADAPIPAKDRIAVWTRAAKCQKHHQQMIFDMFNNSESSRGAKKAKEYAKKMNHKAICTCKG